MCIVPRGRYDGFGAAVRARRQLGPASRDATDELMLVHAGKGGRWHATTSAAYVQLILVKSEGGGYGEKGNIAVPEESKRRWCVSNGFSLLYAPWCFALQVLHGD